MKNFSETPNHADNWYEERLKLYHKDCYPPEGYVFSNRHKKFLELIKKFTKDKRAEILDVGCGLGDMLVLLKKEGYANLTGIDHSQVAVEVCKKNNFRVIKSSIIGTELNEEIKNKKYDVIILGDILEHIYIPSEVLLQFKLLLKDNGIIIVSVPNAGCFINGILLTFFPQLIWLSLAFSSETHIRFYTFYTLKKELSDCGFEVLWAGGVFPDLVDHKLLKLKRRFIWQVVNFLLRIYAPLVSFSPVVFSQSIIVVVKNKN